MPEGFTAIQGTGKTAALLIKSGGGKKRRSSDIILLLLPGIPYPQSIILHDELSSLPFEATRIKFY
jgi:hypothetical protein